MNAKKIVLNRNKLKSDGFVNIPLDNTFDFPNKYEVLKREYFDVEIEKNINPILDYEKVRFTPLFETTKIKKININLTFVKNNSLVATSYLSDLTFVQDDIFFNKNNFSKSFLRLNFYDTDKITTQRLISFYSLYLKILPEYITSNGLYLAGTPMDITTIPVLFRVKDPTIFLDDYSEGFSIYHYRDEVNFDLPKELFMRAVFNNAKNGVSYNLMTKNSALSVDELVNSLHMKYILFRDNTGFYYKIDSDYSTNISLNGDELIIKLYETLSI